MKIYVAAVEALRKSERQDETQFTAKIDDLLSPSPRLNANVLLKKSHLCMTKLRVRVLCFPYFTDNFIANDFLKMNKMNKLFIILVMIF